MLLVYIFAMYRQHAKGIEAVEDAGSFSVCAMGDAEEAQRRGEGARICGIEVESCVVHEEELVYTEPEFIWEVKEAEGWVAWCLCVCL